MIDDSATRSSSMHNSKDHSPAPSKVHYLHRQAFVGRMLGCLAYAVLILLDGPPLDTLRMIGWLFLALTIIWPFLMRASAALFFPDKSSIRGAMLVDRAMLGFIWPLFGCPLAVMGLDSVISSITSLAIGGRKLFVENQMSATMGIIVGLLTFGWPDEVAAPSLWGFVVLSGIVFVYCTMTGHLVYTQAISMKASRRKLRELSQSLEARVHQRTTELRLANEAFRRFVPSEFLHTLGYEDVTKAKLGDVIAKDITILFADVRNFTTLSETMGPEQTFAFLNACLSRLGPLVRQHGGFIDKYIGDAIMALFPSGPASAVHSAIAMQRAVFEYNQRHPDRAPLAVGVGIHVGLVMMGTIGEEERFEATVISDAVNLTARLETLTKQLGCAVLITDEVARHLEEGERSMTRWLGDFAVKGKADAARLIEVFAADSDALTTHKATSRERFRSAIELYQTGSLAEAARLFSELSDACPEDGPARWWASHCRRDLASGATGPRRVVRLSEK